LWKKGAVYRKRENKILNNLSYEEYWWVLLNFQKKLSLIN
jgi:hypothetical protein